MKDYGAVAEACTQFRANAQTVFPLEHRAAQFELLADNWTTRQTENFLKHFGLFIVDLIIRYKEYKLATINRLLKLFVCQSSTASEKLLLQLNRINLEGDIVENLKPLFPIGRIEFGQV